MSEVKKEQQSPAANKTTKAAEESALQGSPAATGQQHRGGGGGRGLQTARGGRGGPQRGVPQRGGAGGMNRGGRGGGFNHENRGGGRGGNMGGRGGNMGGRGGFRGGSNNQSGGQMGRFDRIFERLQAIQGQSTVDLPALDTAEKKFSGRARLYIGNMSNDTTEEQLKEIMAQYGEVGEVFYNREKMFAFLRLSSRLEAEKAKRELDGKMRNGRPLKVRFAPHQGAVKVSNLGPWVSNELLHRAFSIFGDIERCVVFVDERGRGKGEGIVEFERKPSGLEAVKRCGEGCFFLTASLRPVIVEPVEENDDDDGVQEKMLPRRNAEYYAERETGPRFAAPGSFEFEYGAKWKALYEMKKQKLEALDREMRLEEDKLVAQMDYARYEHETEHLREQLRQREASRDQQKNQWEMKERQMEEMIRQEQERRQKEEQNMMNRMQQQETSMRQKQQENSLFMQAQELSQMLDQQEAAINQGGGAGEAVAGGGGRGGGGRQPGRGGFGNGFGGGNRGGFNDEGAFFGNNSGFGRWSNDEGPDGKRRRY